MAARRATNPRSSTNSKIRSMAKFEHIFDKKNTVSSNFASRTAKTLLYPSRGCPKSRIAPFDFPLTTRFCRILWALGIKKASSLTVFSHFGLSKKDHFFFLDSPSCLSRLSFAFFTITGPDRSGQRNSKTSRICGFATCNSRSVDFSRLQNCGSQNPY